MAQPLVTALAKGALLAPSHLNLDRQMDTVQPWGCSPPKKQQQPLDPLPQPPGGCIPQGPAPAESCVWLPGAGRVRIAPDRACRLQGVC